MASPTLPDNDERHDLFYIDTVVFRINKILFKIPSRYLHEQSEIFAAASQMSNPNYEVREGSSDEHPVDLPLPDDATTEDFVQLMKVIYPLTVHLPPPADLDREQWTSVLKLSTFWELNDIRNLAISEISKTNLDLMDKVLLGRSYRVKDWLKSGLNGLVDPLWFLPSLEELQRMLGTETAMQLLYLRNFQMLQVLSCGSFQEDILQHLGRQVSIPGGRQVYNCWRCGKSSHLHPRRDSPTVESVFADELATFD